MEDAAVFNMKHQTSIRVWNFQVSHSRRCILMAPVILQVPQYKIQFTKTEQGGVMSPDYWGIWEQSDLTHKNSVKHDREERIWKSLMSE